MSAEPVSQVVSSGADQRYWDALAEGRVRMPRCAGCGRWHWPAVWRCGECGAWEHDWRDVAPVGTIYAWSRTWHPFPGLEAFGAPFVSLVVEVDGTRGRRLTGVLEGEEAGLAIGARVAGRVGEIAVMGLTLPHLRWRLGGVA